MTLKMTEGNIQHILGTNRDLQTRYDVMIPNCFTLNDNEADMYCIRKSGLADEIEIKISRGDFRLDEKKVVRTGVLQENARMKWTRKPKREALANGEMTNYFWYCVPEGLIQPEEIPEWAGLMYITPHRMVRTVRSPKRLHANKVTFEDRYYSARKLGYRYWRTTQLSV